MKKILLVLTSVALLVVVFIIMQTKFSPDSTNAVNNNVTMIDGTQVVEIEVKGGYSPRISNAQANIATIIKMKTRGTFDCSSAVVIPSIGYQANLPLSGETNIPIPAQPAGTSLKGLCSMGMYSFQIAFN